jgi:hypothetical protein
MQNFGRLRATNSPSHVGWRGACAWPHLGTPRDQLHDPPQGQARTPHRCAAPASVLSTLHKGSTEAVRQEVLDLAHKDEWHYLRRPCLRGLRRSASPRSNSTSPCCRICTWSNRVCPCRSRCAAAGTVMSVPLNEPFYAAFVKAVAVGRSERISLTVLGWTRCFTLVIISLRIPYEQLHCAA